MPTLPATNPRKNLATFSVPAQALPAVAKAITDAYPVEVYDPNFYGQFIQTTYFDTHHFDFRKARLKADQYLTLRLRFYASPSSAGGNYPNGVFAISAKTNDDKYRVPATIITAEDLLIGDPTPWPRILPANMLALFLHIADGKLVHPVVTVHTTRFAVENTNDRITLDTNIRTDTGRHEQQSVLEFKSNLADPPPQWLTAVPGLRPIKLSKFLWATER